MQTNHLITTASHPQCNGLVERFNHTFAEMFSMFVNSSHSNWDDVIDHVVFAYNTSRQESTGMTPFLMLYGREAVLPIDFALGNSPNFRSRDPLQFIHRIPIIREQVKRRLLFFQHHQRIRYNALRQKKWYAAGDLVWVQRPTRKKGRSDKLMHSFHGPFLIVEKVSAVNYGVCSTRDKKKRIDHVHVCNFKPFIPRTLIPNSLPFPPISCDPVSTTGGVIAEGVSGLTVGHPDIEKITNGVVAEF